MGLNSVTSQEVFMIPAVHAAVKMKKNQELTVAKSVKPTHL